MSAISVTPEIGSPSAQSADDFIRPLVRDLHKVRRSIYWADLLGSSVAGWSCFAAALRGAWGVWSEALLVAGALLCLYRSLCFVHELSHQTSRALPGFELAYNLLVGFPLLMPSFVYVGVHQNHHRIDLYGTEHDPEYLPFSRSWLMTTVFAAESMLIPVILLIRFLLLAPAGVVSGRLHQWLAVHLSSLMMNPKYRRSVSPELLNRMRRDSLFMLAIWALPIGASLAGLASWRWLAVWLVVVAAISLINTVRTLGAHAYESDGQPMDREAQLHDSIDTPGAFWTELWAPVGLRYHALHHYYPGIPYHNLPEAYRRIVHSMPGSIGYREMSSPGLPHSLRALLRRGRGSR